MFASYVQLAHGLVGEISGVCLMDHHWRVRGVTGRISEPLLDCVHRDLAAALPLRERVQTLTERTAELEWLSGRTLGLDYAQGDGVEAIQPLDEVLKSLSEDESRRLGRLYLES